MNTRLSRRTLLQHVATGAVLGIGSSSLIRRVAAEPTEKLANPTRVASLVQLLETTPRNQVIESFGAQVIEGASYSDVLAAVLTASVREVQPRPSVGFKFHTVLATISYQLISDQLAETERWLPLFWGLDYFKVAQASDVSEGDWKLGEASETKLPSADQAADVLVQAMQRWDEPTADRAATAVARQLNPEAAFELFFPLGARDFRSIGHKAIFVMGAKRTLERIGWQFAEPVLRSLAYALLMHEDGNPANRDASADRPWRNNQQLVGKIRDGWDRGRIDDDTTRRLLQVFRSGSADDACDAVVEALNRGVAPASIWDAIFCGAAELQFRAPNIASLHAITTSRAIHYAYRSTIVDRTRRLLLLQNAAFIPLFREAARQRGQFRDQPIEQLEAIGSDESAEKTLNRIIEELGGQRRTAAERIAGYLQAGRSEDQLAKRIFQLVALKGDGSHDFKFTSAILESAGWVSPAWRGRFLAGGAMHFCAADQRDNAIVARVRKTLNT